MKDISRELHSVDKKAARQVDELPKRSLTGFIIIFIVTNLFAIFLGAIFSEPINQFWLKMNGEKPKLEVIPSLYPTAYANASLVRVDITNIGKIDVTNMSLSYRFPCYMNKTAKAPLHTSLLKSGQHDFFEIPVPLVLNCSTSTKTYDAELFKDKRGQCFFKSQGEVKSSVCMYCDLNMSIESEDFYQAYSSRYPYFEGEVAMELTSENCRPYDEAANKSELVSQGPFGITIMDPSTRCLSDPSFSDWCSENGFIK